MKQVVVDTNILLDFTRTREPSYSKVLPLFEKVKSGQVQLIILLPVFLAYEWILRSFYKVDRPQLLVYLQGLIDSYSVEDESVLRYALTIHKNYNNISLTDAVILAIKNSKYTEAKFMTNDRDLKKLI